MQGMDFGVWTTFRDDVLMTNCVQYSEVRQLYLAMYIITTFFMYTQVKECVLGCSTMVQDPDLTINDCRDTCVSIVVVYCSSNIVMTFFIQRQVIIKHCRNLLQLISVLHQ